MSPRRTTPKNQKNANVRITDQFHVQQRTVYELKCDGIDLSISMIQVEPTPNWEAEATAKAEPGPLVAKGVGRSREEAFSVLRETWSAQRDGAPFPRLDWEAIRQALSSVRAI